MPVILFGSKEPHNLSIFDPVSPAGEEIRALSVLVLVICVVIFLIVEGVLVYSLVRFRRRRGQTEPLATDTNPPSEPAQLYASMPIEFAWTAAPAIVVFILALVTARTLWQVEVDPPAPAAGDNALFVTVIGRQWWWEYRYDYFNGEKLDFVTANELHVPVSSEGTPRKVFLTLKSADVAHSFWVPRLGGKTDLLPGRTNHMWFQTDRPGLYVGQCAEYCGEQHAKMLLRVYVESVTEFEGWVANQKKPAVEDSKVAKGKKVFLSESCINCHRIRGTRAQGNYAPDLTHLMSRETLASGIIANDEAKLLAWIRDPQAIKPGCLMPAFGLSDEELRHVVEYLRTLR